MREGAKPLPSFWLDAAGRCVEFSDLSELSDNFEIRLELSNNLDEIPEKFNYLGQNSS